MNDISKMAFYMKNKKRIDENVGDHTVRKIAWN